MSEIFNPKRFAAYARKQYSENRKVYLFGAIFVLLLTALCFWSSIQQGGIMVLGGRQFFHPGKALYATLAGLGFFTLFYLHWSTQEWRSRSKSVPYTLTPASNFEKFGFIWLNSIVLLPLFFLLAFGIMYGVFSLFYFHSAFSDLREILPILVPAFLFGHALVFFLFATVRRNALLAYVLLAAIFILYFIALPQWLQKWGIIGYTPSDLFYSAYSVRTDEFRYDVSWIGAGVRPMVHQLLALLVTATLWTAGYFKFKERQLK